MIGLAQMMWRAAWMRAGRGWPIFPGGPFVSREKFERERQMASMRNERRVTREYYAMVDRINRGEAP